MIRYSRRNAFVFVLSMAMFVSSSSCSNSRVLPPEPSAIQTMASGPLVVSLVGDTSVSMDRARSTPLQESDLQSLIQLVRASGGAISLGLIGETTKLPLVRLKIPTPPKEPVKPTGGNPFTRTEKMNLYHESMRQFATDYQNWDREVGQRVETFLAQARERLAAPRVDRTSPVYEAFERVNLFLAEPGDWPGNTRRVTLIQSDCKDSTKHKPVHLNPGTTVLVVNGAGSLGVLANASPTPKQFEAMSSAIEFIKTELR